MTCMIKNLKVRLCDKEESFKCGLQMCWTEILVIPARITMGEVQIRDCCIESKEGNLDGNVQEQKELKYLLNPKQ